MWATAETIAGYLDELASPEFAAPGDSAGLQLGDLRVEVSTLLVAPELDQAALEKASAQNAGMIVTYHPIFFSPLRALDERTLPGTLIARAIRQNLCVYSVHTNLDIAPRGSSHLLAELMGLVEQERRVIQITGRDQLMKLVVFVPAGYEDKVREALAEAGAGWIGAYSHCTFQTAGTGTFMPREGTDPFIGRQGRLEKVDEFRLETVLPESRRRAVLEALYSSHPYEEVAYDLYGLEREGQPIGLGLLSYLKKPLSLEQILERCRDRFKLSVLHYWAPPKKEFSRIAVYSGSGGSLLEQASRLGAELFISAELSYYDLKLAMSAGMGLVDVGRCGLNRLAVELIVEYLSGRFTRAGYQTAVIPADLPAVDWGIA